MSYIPPEFAQEPMEITQRGSIICSYSRRITGAILMKTVPAITIRSASLGVPRITSAPNREMSYLLVMLVAISTKQQDSPKWKGQIEFLRPHATRSSNFDSTSVRRTSASRGSGEDLSICWGAFTWLTDHRMENHLFRRSSYSY